MCMVQTDENSSLDSAEATLGEIGSSEPPHHRHSKRLSCSLRPFQLSLFLSPGVPKNQVPLLRGDAAGEPRRRRSRGLGSASTASETSSVLAQGRSTSGSRRRLQALHRSLARGGGGQAAGSQDRRHGSLKATLRGAQLSLKQRRRRRGARLSQGRAEGGKKLSAPCLFCSSGTKKKKNSLSNPLGFRALLAAFRPTHEHTGNNFLQDECPSPAPLLCRDAVIQRTRRERQAKQRGDAVDSFSDHRSSPPHQQQHRRVQVSPTFFDFFAA